MLAAFALSALQDARVLSGAAFLALLVFRRGSLRRARRLALSVLPVAAGLSFGSFAWLRFIQGEWPAPAPFIAMVLRVVTIAFIVVSVLERVDLLRALAPLPFLSRLVVLTLAQAQALRLLLTESRDGLRSRMARRPSALDILRNASAISAALFTLCARNAREISDAMRSRGF